MEAIAVPGYTETTATAGTGFGLGFSCILDPIRTGQINSVGSFRWGGAASTTFWCDPVENLFVVFMTQLMFRNELVLPLTTILKQMVYGAIDDTPSECKEKVLNLEPSLAGAGPRSESGSWQGPSLAEANLLCRLAGKRPRILLVSTSHLGILLSSFGLPSSEI